jgi:hypothetical protein
MEAKITKPVYLDYKWTALSGRGDFSRNTFVP